MQCKIMLYCCFVMLCSVDSVFSVGDYMLSDSDNVPFEGVTLDILHGNAVFVSGLTERVLVTKDLKALKSFDELVLLIRDLCKLQWFTDHMRYQIERYFIGCKNGY